MQAAYDYSYGVIPVWHETDRLQVLILQHNAGHWSFPKGHPEANETPVQAAERELREETAVTNVVLRQASQFPHQYNFQKNGVIYYKTVTYFLGYIYDSVVSIAPEEIRQYRWAYPEDARQLLRFDGQSNPAFEQFLSWWRRESHSA